jgi:hypothetical protein
MSHGRYTQNLTKNISVRAVLIFVTQSVSRSTGTVLYTYIQGVPGGKVNILGGHIVGHSKQKTLYEHVSYSEQFPR